VDALVLRDQSSLHNGTLDQRLYVQQDANGNVTALVSTTGSVLERYAYAPYGAVTVMSPGWSALGASAYGAIYLWQGKRYDGAVGLYDSRGRAYSPTLMRPMQADPLGLGPDVNDYRWEGDGPTGALDPSGLGPLQPGGKRVGADWWLSGSDELTGKPTQLKNDPFPFGKGYGRIYIDGPIFEISSVSGKKVLLDKSWIEFTLSVSDGESVRDVRWIQTVMTIAYKQDGDKLVPFIGDSYRSAGQGHKPFGEWFVDKVGNDKSPYCDVDSYHGKKTANITTIMDKPSADLGTYPKVVKYFKTYPVYKGKVLYEIYWTATFTRARGEDNPKYDILGGNTPKSAPLFFQRDKLPYFFAANEGGKLSQLIELDNPILWKP
jgi:RHS repeat-associated protein